MPVELFRHILKTEPSSPYFQTYAPGEDLAFVVEYYFLYTITSSQKQELAFADGTPILAFLLNDQTNMVFRRNNQVEPINNQGYLSGILLEGTYIHSLQPGQQLFGIRFTPTGLHHLIQKPLSGFKKQTFSDPKIVFGKPGLQLISQVAESKSIPEKINAIEQWMRQQLLTSESDTRLFEEVVAFIRSRQGMVNVHEMASTLNVNYKWLERKFQIYTGVTPKEFTKLQRFLHSLFDLQATEGRDLMGTAINHGYYDQNHFTKDFKRFTQKAPLQFLQWLTETRI